MLQKKKYITPTTRFASIINIIDQTPTKLLSKVKKKKNLCLKRKIFFAHNATCVTAN